MATAEWRGTSDHNVTETAFDAVKCKLSAVTLGYFEDPFLRFFVDKPTRRIPLIHRGYYLRHLAITRCVELFLSQNATSSCVNILSLGAGFDTMFFRLLEQRGFSGSLNFVEVDCDVIVKAKIHLLNSEDIRAGLFPNGTAELTVEPSNDKVAWQCHAPSATYSLISCDLGDVARLAATLDAAGVERNLPTFILSECVLSYLAPEKGNSLLRWLGDSFPSGSIALYDPIGLRTNSERTTDNVESSDEQTKTESSPFGTTLQRYFAVKGCTLRGARGFQTATDHARRLVALGHWQKCSIVDMNGVFEICVDANERRRLTSLEPFDEYTDWVLSNSHYAIYLAENVEDVVTQWTTRFVLPTHQHRLLVTANIADRKNPEAIIRSFQQEDLATVRSLFESTHLEFAHGSRAVRQFVANRLRGPNGDMFDVKQSFQVPNQDGIMTSGFWIAEVDGEVVGCVGVKPLISGPKSADGNHKVAELCRLSVASTHRRRGLASALVARVEDFVACSDSLQEIQLETIGVMEGAQQLYRRLGYTEQESDSDKKHSGSFTLVRFKKEITRSA